MLLNMIFKYPDIIQSSSEFLESFMSGHDCTKSKKVLLVRLYIFV